MNIIFGTDGWRGLLDSEMNDDTVSVAAQAFSDYININFNKPSIAVGYDGRRNSKRFAELFCSVLSGNMIDAILSDAVVPTPALSYYVKRHALNAGVMITASHNPAEYNGVKFKAGYGGPFFTEETKKVEELLYSTSVKKSAATVNAVNLLQDYIAHVRSMVNFDTIRSSGIKVLIDSMSGAGAGVLEEILKTEGCRASTIFGTPQEDFSGRYAEPIEKNLAPLKEMLSEEKDYSLGLATDGDADRLGILLENGSWLSAQETILLLADFVKNRKRVPGGLVKTSSVTDKLRSVFESDSCRVYDVQVGFKYICEKMIEQDVAFGCEESGGYGYKGHIPERDGILSGLFVLEMLAESGFDKLSALVNQKRKEFGEIYYDRIDHKYDGGDRLEKLPSLYDRPPESAAGLKINRIEKYYSSRGIINGLKFILEGDSRWLLMRSSETEPLIRIYAEGQSGREVKDFLNAGISLINLKV